MSKASINILFTSVGRRVELLRAFRRAYELLELKGSIVALDIDPLAPALRVADRPFIVPRLEKPDYILRLIEICKMEKVKLIFPLIDPDIHALARSRREIEATGAKVAVVSKDAAAIGTDKWLAYEFFKELGLYTPRSWLQEEIEATRIAFPLFIKPRRGSAARGIFVVHNARELQFFLKYVPDPIVQECLPGPEITNDVICDLQGEVLAVVSRQRIEVRWGEVAKGMTVYDAAITKACVRIAEALPAVGPITVQCMLKEGLPYFTEINARLAGGAPLTIAAGVDFPLWLLARVAGIHVDIPPLGTYRKGIYLTRFDDSFFLSENEREQMASDHL